MDFRAEFPEKYWDLIERYRAELLNQAVSILGAVDDAEDVVQETFCAAFRDSTKLSQADSIGAWLRTINRHNALNHLRGKRRDSKRSRAADKTFTTGGISALGVQESIAKALESLPPNMRAVVVLRYWEHLSYKEIAKRLGLPVGSVGRLRYEATMCLYEKLKIYFDGQPPANDAGDEA